MWVSQAEIEDDESLEIINKLNSTRQLEDEELENQINVIPSFSDFYL